MTILAEGQPMPTEFNILDYPYPLPERAAVPTLREKFEAQALVLAPKHYRHANCETALRTLFERRTDGTYSIDWVDGAWIGYQAAIEAVSMITIDQPTLDRMYERTKALIDAGEPRFMVVLPRPFMSGYTESGNCPATDLYSFDDVKSAIEAAGGTVTK